MCVPTWVRREGGRETPVRASSRTTRCIETYTARAVDLVKDIIGHTYAYVKVKLKFVACTSYVFHSLPYSSGRVGGAEAARRELGPAGRPAGGRCVVSVSRSSDATS